MDVQSFLLGMFPETLPLMFRAFVQQMSLEDPRSGSKMRWHGCPSGMNFTRLTTDEESRRFHTMLGDHYRALGFIESEAAGLAFMPRDETRLYGIEVGGEMAAICALNRVEDADSIFWRYVPQLREGGKTTFEFNNVVVAKDHRGGTVLPYLLCRVVEEAIDCGAEYVCGIVRYEVLRFFVSLGAEPVPHPPLHVLPGGRYDDHIVYFDCSNPNAVWYLREHTKRLVARERILHQIRREHKAYKTAKRCANTEDSHGPGTAGRALI